MPHPAEKLVDIVEVGVVLVGPVHGNVADTFSVKEEAQEALGDDVTAKALLGFSSVAIPPPTSSTEFGPPLGTYGITGFGEGETDGEL